jgi:hypothetical protein
MELTAYLLVAFLSFFFSVKRKVVTNSSIFFFVWFSTYFALILIVRNKFDVDINTYANSMSFSSLKMYYLKEPVVWLGQRYLFGFTQDSHLVFVIFDVILGLVLYESLARFRVPQYAYFSFLIFFPFILGIQNVYRQWVATIIFLYCFSFVWSGNGGIKAYVLFAFSFLSHNVAAIFVPLLFINKRGLFGKLLWYSSFLISFIGIVVGADTKSSAETGADLSEVYLLLLIFFLMLIPLLDRGVIRKAKNLEYRLFFGLFILAVCATLVLSSTGAERVSMFCMMISYPILVNILEERFKQKIYLRLSFSVLGFAPMFFFGVSKFILE